MAADNESIIRLIQLPTGGEEKEPTQCSASMENDDKLATVFAMD
jgi:hypothetical protein